mmetsp:Transcript_4736/g.15244  ORF Transcript_4736/g.15244 Transcript_4736/m.15244 type:complete len:93 (-) Transcript_4736:172-450(-)
MDQLASFILRDHVDNTLNNEEERGAGCALATLNESCSLRIETIGEAFSRARTTTEVRAEVAELWEAQQHQCFKIPFDERSQPSEQLSKLVGI